MNSIILAEEETKTIKYINNGKQSSSEYICSDTGKINIRRVPLKKFMKSR